ncbi:ribonuclease domain-containing protein [Thermodesulfobacteriota bacterium]
MHHAENRPSTVALWTILILALVAVLPSHALAHMGAADRIGDSGPQQTWSRFPTDLWSAEPNTRQVAGSRPQVPVQQIESERADKGLWAFDGASSEDRTGYAGCLTHGLLAFRTGSDPGSDARSRRPRDKPGKFKRGRHGKDGRVYQIPPVGARLKRYVKGVTIKDKRGRVVFRGKVDLRPEFDRIRDGRPDKHRRDGSVFGNREKLLPRNRRGYYREYVVRTPGLRGVGPQRLVTGAKGEVYYTPDHYKTFIPLHK